MEKFDIANDPERIEIDFMESKVSDHSGMEAIKNVVEKYEKLDKKVTLKHLSPDCDALLMKANPHFKDIIITDSSDPRYFVVTDEEAI
jgi:SulP family sulfate permease